MMNYRPPTTSLSGARPNEIKAPIARLNDIPKHYDAIVLGVGAMGASTCYQLAKPGKRVLGLEQFSVPHEQGSSHGMTRIIRLAYYEHPSYVNLLRRSYELCTNWKRRSTRNCFTKQARLMRDPKTAGCFKDHGARARNTIWNIRF